MKEFEYYLKEKKVRKVSPDLDLAKSLVKDMNMRILGALELSSGNFAKLIFESIYDGLRDFCDAILALEGYKSYSHEASISYLSKRGFDIVFIGDLDLFRYKRNGSKYYGTSIDSQDVKEIKEFYFSNKPKIEKLLKELKLL